MINAKDIVAVGKEFSKMVFHKYFMHLDENEWQEFGDGSPHTGFTFGETEDRADKNIPVEITDVLFFGTRTIQPQFSMKLEKDWKGDYVNFSFGLQAWETDAAFCKLIIRELIEFLEKKEIDWLIGTYPRFEECLPNQRIQWIPTGKKSVFLYNELLSTEAETPMGFVLYDGYNYSIKDVEKLSFVKVNDVLSLKDELQKNKEINLTEFKKRA